jgi:hypothetical protein
MSTYKEIEKDGLKLSIVYDESPDSPREWDNLGVIACWSSRHNLSDKNAFPCSSRMEVDDFLRWLAGMEYGDDAKDELTRDELYAKAEEHAVILPLYLYDHSGITIKTHPFSCPWDSGQVGYIYCTKEKMIKEYGPAITGGIRDKVKAVLEAEIKTFDQYLTGEVYGFKLEKSVVCSHGDTHHEELDSCWGFFGDEGIKGIREHLAKEYESLFDELMKK